MHPGFSTLPLLRQKAVKKGKPIYFSFCRSPLSAANVRAIGLHLFRWCWPGGFHDIKEHHKVERGLVGLEKH